MWIYCLQDSSHFSSVQGSVGTLLLNFKPIEKEYFVPQLLGKITYGFIVFKVSVNINELMKCNHTFHQYIYNAQNVLFFKKIVFNYF